MNLLLKLLLILVVTLFSSSVYADIPLSNCKSACQGAIKDIQDISDNMKQGSINLLYENEKCRKVLPDAIKELNNKKTESVVKTNTKLEEALRYQEQCKYFGEMLAVWTALQNIIRCKCYDESS